ncbi:OsmC family peroxiredoxin [Vibrio cholerae]|nr:OsmC family peroxiredoxin [Vibrio cholerae]
MSEHSAIVSWKRKNSEALTDNQYSRAHIWEFDGGSKILASASPHVVPIPLSVEAHVDPEEAFVAALSSCDMLVFLSIAAKQRYLVESYTDNAIGILGKNSKGKTSVTNVVLRPQVIFSGARKPTLQQLEKMHHLAHENCFIANSVETEVVTEIIA